MTIEQTVTEHYTRGDLEETILAGLRAIGKDPDHLSPGDLSPVDEFHLGGPAATEDVAGRAGIDDSKRVVDLGCGIGGPARLYADRFGAQAFGVDLTPEFILVANSLTSRCGLEDKVSFMEGSILALPLDDADFDVATLMHVGMNIADKAKLCREAARVLKPGGIFAIFDIMRVGEQQPLEFPVPWAVSPDDSFVESPEDYQDHLVAAGFRVESVRNRRDLALEFFARMAPGAGPPPPLGLHLVLGPDGGRRMGNLAAGVQAGSVAPVEIIARRG